MGIDKLSLYIFIMGIMLFQSCNTNKSEAPSVPQETYDQLLQKYDMLREQVEGTLSANEEARVELNGIMVELNEITGRTISLQKNMENGADMDMRTTAEHISEAIRDIKKRLNAVSEKKIDKQQIALIDNLRKTIALNEQEISRLNSVIEDKNQQISTLDSELADTNEQLRQAYEEMKRAEMQSWLDMGDELINTADLLPDVKGHGNMKPIKSAKLTILLRAKSAYQQAYQLGCAEAISKIRVAENKYRYAVSR
jgi:DNA repair exonuclease SbcCD ATPase subunit